MLPLQEAVQVLIKHSADVNARDKNWQTPLHVAAANKAVKCAEVIIPMLSSVNVSDRGGRTALHHAALNGHIEVSWLIAKLIFDYLLIFSSFKCLSTMAGFGLSLISLTPVIAVIQLLPKLCAKLPIYRSKSGRKACLQSWHASELCMQTWGAGCATSPGNSSVSWAILRLTAWENKRMERRKNC